MLSVAPRTAGQVASATSGDAGALVDAIGRILVGGIGLTTRSLAEVPEAAELTLAQWRVLVLVGDADGVRIGELAEHVGVAEPSASRLVRRLERRGFVSATRDELDRRATNVRLSDQGRRIRDLVLGRRRDLILRATEDAGQGVDDELIERLARIADALADFA